MSPLPDVDRPSMEDRLALRRLAELFSLPRLERGWVWLAGAGPGDPGLASFLTFAAIAEADVIVSDALVNDSLLALARPEAKIIDAGKRGGKPSPKQAVISGQLVNYARKGLRVLRLKGGDPFVFGRGGEEAQALVRAKIPFRIVPGITAGTGGLAYAGIPVTHRETNQAVTFLTGYGADGKIPDFRWDAIAQGSPTLVFYMARKHAGEIAARLIDAGRPIDEPAAIISNASLADQTTQLTTLGELGRVALEAQTPAIIVIGENVRLAAGLDWLGAALHGRVLDPDPLKNSTLRNTG
ncbi:MAG: uroporphyrinogen-III C-methyltransferase [Pseudomonadota bacterium]|jgi:uroporphyrin-III C-methyltransferase